MNEGTPIQFTPDVGVVARAIIYLFSLYYAFHLFREKPLRKTGSASSDEAENENDETDWVAARSSPTKPVVRLSCVPFDGPQGRIDAGIAIDTTNGNVIIHGGGGRQNNLLADIQIFNCDQLQWQQYPFTPNQRRHFGMATASNGMVVVFGGKDNRQQASDALNTITFTPKGFDWSDHNSSDQQPWPEARYGHAMCLCADGQAAMWGGCDSSGKQLTELWLLNTKVLACGYNNGETLWTKVDPKGYTRPKPRNAPSIAHLAGKIFLFGKTKTLRSRGEVELFNLTTLKYEREITCGEEPFKMDCHVHPLENALKLVTVSMKESSECGLFNRMDVLDTQTEPMAWSRLELDWFGDYTMIPGARTCFSSAMDSSAGVLYIFGGERGGSDGEEEGKELLSTLIIANFSRYHATEGCG